MIREITLLVDDDDWRDVWAELQIRDGRCLPDTEYGANEAGRCVGEIVRDLWEYRSLWERNHDDEQIDAAWLPSVGFLFDEYYRHWIRPVNDEASLHLTCLAGAWNWCLHYDQDRAAGMGFNGTRGTLRVLCRVFGAPLKEPIEA